MREPGGVRIGDAERRTVVELLRDHTVEGRLTLDEFSELVEQVFAAVTRADLEQVLADLPDGVRPPAGSEPGPAARSAAAPAGSVEPARPAQSLRRGEPRRRFVAVMCESQARGAWRAPPRISAFAWWGEVNLDLRHALIESPVVEISAWALMGGVRITVPPGIPVELDGLVIMGGARNTVRDHDPIPGAPLVRVRARGLWGGVKVRNPRPRDGDPPDDDGGGGDRGRRGRGRHGHHTHHEAALHEVALARAERHVERARRVIEHALPPGDAGEDRIPPMPGQHDRGDPARARRGAGPTALPAATSDATGPAPTTTAGATHATAIPPPAPQPSGATPGRIPSGTLTMLVSDIADSTGMAERLGDQAWIEVLHAHNAVVRRQVAEHGGTEVKTRGDGFLVVFPSARAAVLAAISIQRALRRYRDEHPDLPVQVRLGLHTGEVVVAEDDVFGRNVVVASRIADAAEPGEIVVSSLTRDLTSSASDLGFDEGRDVTLKGVSQTWRVHRVLWS